MGQYFRYEAVRRRLHVGPLSGYLDAFARQLSESGYAIDTGQQQLRVVSHLSQWMGRRDLQAHDLGEPVLKRFLAERRRQGRRGTPTRGHWAGSWSTCDRRASWSRCPRSPPTACGGPSIAISSTISSRSAGWPRRRSTTTWGPRHVPRGGTSTRRRPIRNGCAPPMSSASSSASRSRNRPPRRSADVVLDHGAHVRCEG